LRNGLEKITTIKNEMCVTKLPLFDINTRHIGFFVLKWLMECKF